MLQTLKIENVALIDKVVLDFDEKLNVISGETGAGKSIMLDALSFVFGGRADRSLIRENETKMRVEAVFCSLNEKQVAFVLDEVGVECGDELFLSRELDQNGKNVCKINGELVPLMSVKKICRRLVDVHGQTDHLAILDNDYQLDVVDLFGKNSFGYLEKLSALIVEVKAVENELKSLGGSAEEKQNLIDLYTYQTDEIERAKIGENEAEELQNEKRLMQQSEKINSELTACYELNCRNNFGEASVEKISASLKNIQSISELSDEYKALETRLESVLIELEDINETVGDLRDKNVFDETRFEFVDTRLDFIKTMFRKYGGNYENMTAYYLDAKKKLDNLINGEKRYNELTAKKEALLEKIDAVQDKLSEVRKLAGKNLSARLQEELKRLGMPGAKIEIKFSKKPERYTERGYDDVEFMFSSNLGFELKPLNKVVSGGEMSRVMLAYKIVVSAVDEINTIVFDEIDTGLSGNIAQVVAEYMARLAMHKQIIAISHLPQIASMADKNIKVEKYSDKTTTRTKAVDLTDVDLYDEIARLMGAMDSVRSRDVGEELKQQANKFKNSLMENK